MSNQFGKWYDHWPFKMFNPKNKKPPSYDYRKEKNWVRDKNGNVTGLKTDPSNLVINEYTPPQTYSKKSSYEATMADAEALLKRSEQAINYSNYTSQKQKLPPIPGRTPIPFGPRLLKPLSEEGGAFGRRRKNNKKNKMNTINSEINYLK